MAHKYLFFDDYSEGAHPRILEAFSKTNLQQEAGYGYDSFTKSAAELIQQKIQNSDADVHFVSSGTQANLVVLSSLLKPYESVIAAESGHTNHHEAGAIEATGHKINTVEVKNGKLTPEAISKVLDSHADEYMVKPRAVYISQATELGTAYTKPELEAISKTCKENSIYLYVDGARLGSALAAFDNDLDIATLAKLVDVFYIGGTKNGALIGEVIVIVNPELKENFRRHLRQRGALLAKGRAVSLQFLELFKGDLYLQNAKHANDMAQQLAQGIKECGYEFLVESHTNQIFPILPNSIIEKLNSSYGFHTWAKTDSNNSVIRLVTSWATPEEAITDFTNNLKKLTQL